MTDNSLIESRKIEWYSPLRTIIMLVIDLVLIDISFLLGYYLRFGFDDPFSSYYTSLVVVYNLAWIAAALFNDIYQIDGNTRNNEILLNLIYTFILQAFLVFTFIVSFKIYEFSRLFILYSFLLSIISIVSIRFLLINVYKYYKNTDGNYRRVVVVGTGRSASDLFNFFQAHKALGYQFLGMFDNHVENTLNEAHVRGKLSDLKEFCLREKVNEIYFALPMTNADLIKDLSTFADNNFISFKIAPDFSTLIQKKVNIYFYDNIPIFTIRKEPLSILFNRILKRSFDIAFSLGVILLIFPFIFPFIILAIKLESPGPIFFIQRRPGKNNKLFNCMKFRTMRVNNETERQATKNDNRITQVGAFLRKTSLDELPQFFNVLMGDMSVVGPRPNMFQQLQHYSQLIDTYVVRHFVTPGITEYAQINGFRGETKELELMQKRVEYDIMYMERKIIA